MKKYEREIEEILKNLDEFVPEEPLTSRLAKKARSWRLSVNLPLHKWRSYLTMQYLMVASIALVMLGFVMRMFSGRLASYLNMLGLLLFVLALLVSVLHLGRPGQEKKWRGKPIDLHSNSDWWRSLQRRWRLWRRGRGR